MTQADYQTIRFERAAPFEGVSVGVLAEQAGRLATLASNLDQRHGSMPDGAERRAVAAQQALITYKEEDMRNACLMLQAQEAYDALCQIVFLRLEIIELFDSLEPEYSERAAMARVWHGLESVLRLLEKVSGTSRAELGDWYTPPMCFQGHMTAGPFA